MGPLTPIGQMCRDHGESAVVYVLEGSTSDDYDPSSGEDFQPSAPDAVPVVGFISHTPEGTNGLDQSTPAAFTIQTFAPIQFLLTGQSHILWDGIDYKIMDARPRRYKGALDGYTLTLSA